MPERKSLTRNPAEEKSHNLDALVGTVYVACQVLCAGLILMTAAPPGPVAATTNGAALGRISNDAGKVPIAARADLDIVEVGKG